MKIKTAKTYKTRQQKLGMYWGPNITYILLHCFFVDIQKKICGKFQVVPVQISGCNPPAKDRIVWEQAELCPGEVSFNGPTR